MPEEKRLHIITFDVPYPADYGGAVDMFYRIKAFSELGYQLTIHVFEYGRGRQKELEKYGKVIYYIRSKSFLNLFSSTPFIVKSRKSTELLKNLLGDDAPIFFEGLHSTYFLSNPELSRRMTYVRTHNIEHEYYSDLSNKQHIFKKLFFRWESLKLRKYEKILSKAKKVLAIKSEDRTHFLKINPNTEILNASIPEFETHFAEMKNYALFHGNLSIQENELAVYWILDAIKENLSVEFPFFVAGKNPSKKLIDYCNTRNVILYSNPDERALNKLISEAKIHVFYTDYPSGVKLKLLNALNSKGQVLINESMTKDDEVKNFCEIALSKSEYSMRFENLKNRFLSEEEFKRRIDFLRNNYSTKENIKKII